MERPPLRYTLYYVYYNREAYGLIMRTICYACKPPYITEMRVSDYHIAEQLFYGWLSLHGHHDRNQQENTNDNGSEQ
jgi:hypothetical protein